MAIAGLLTGALTGIGSTLLPKIGQGLWNAGKGLVSGIGNFIGGLFGKKKKDNEPRTGGSIENYAQQGIASGAQWMQDKISQGARSIGERAGQWVGDRFGGRAGSMVRGGFDRAGDFINEQVGRGAGRLGAFAQDALSNAGDRVQDMYNRGRDAYNSYGGNMGYNGGGNGYGNVGVRPAVLTPQQEIQYGMRKRRLPGMMVTY